MVKSKIGKSMKSTTGRSMKSYTSYSTLTNTGTKKKYEVQHMEKYGL